MVKHAIAPLVILVTLFGLSARGGETILLDFASPTCGPCQQMMPTVESLQQAGYPVRRVDVTREPELATQFHVDRVPCFVMLSDGREVDRLLGATSRGQLEQMIQHAGGRRGENPDDRIRTASPELQVSTPQAGGRNPLRPSLTPTPPANQATATNVSWIGAGDVPARSASRQTAEDITSRDPKAADLVASSVRIRVDDAAGRSFGTGTIIDARKGEALIITCGHLFRDSKGDGPVTVDLFTAGPDGAKTIGQVSGQVISFNLDRDIGLVSIRPGRPVRVAPIAQSQMTIERGDHVTSVGCDHGKDPTALASWVTATNRYKGSPNIEANGAPVEGRSGGGLFSSDGKLVGICFAADYEGNEGLYTALETIHDELDRVGLGDIYRGPSAAIPPKNDVAAQSPPTRPQGLAPSADQQVIRFSSPGGRAPARNDVVLQPQAANPPVIRGQEPSTPSAVQPGLNQSEQAAWDEIIKSAATSEVICIIRPKDAGGKSEVITLDNVSPDFVRTLASHTSAAPTTRTR
jgi:thiol-disulfide isomerase/thioredoxin